MNKPLEVNQIIIKPKVSVIVPVYNTERYVERAIVSLMEQTLDEVEFIIIDDGSSDNSVKIIRNVFANYPNRKDNIVFIQRENRGVAATRAEGISLATGEYTIHCDSDDYCDNNMLFKMYHKAKDEDLDILISDFVLDYKNNKILQSQKVANGNDCISLLLRADLDVSLSNKLIRKSLYVDNEVHVVRGLDMGEDFCTILRLFYYAKKVGYLEFVSFYYNKHNSSSATSHYTEKSLNDLVAVVIYVENFLKKKNIFDKYSRDFLEYKIIVKNLHLWNGIEKKEIFKKGIELFPEISNFTLIKTDKISLFLKFIFIIGKVVDSRSIFLLKEKIRLSISSRLLFFLRKVL